VFAFCYVLFIPAPDLNFFHMLVSSCDLVPVVCPGAHLRVGSAARIPGRDLV
jgi:hypothetical protein